MLTQEQREIIKSITESCREAASNELYELKATYPDADLPSMYIKSVVIASSDTGIPFEIRPEGNCL